MLALLGGVSWAWAAAAAAILPNLCHETASFRNYFGNGTGNASVDSESGCTLLHFKSAAGMAADFTASPFSVKPLQHYLVSMELKTSNLLPTPLLPNCIEQMLDAPASAAALQPDSPKFQACQGAYLTGGAYVTYTDGAGRKDGWYMVE